MTVIRSRLAAYLVLCDNDWFKKMSDAEQQRYLKEHPDSELLKTGNGSGKDSAKKGVIKAEKTRKDDKAGKNRDEDENKNKDEDEEEHLPYGELEDSKIEQHANAVVKTTANHPDVAEAAENIKTGTASDDTIGRGSLALADAVLARKIIPDTMAPHVAVNGDLRLGLAGALAQVAHRYHNLRHVSRDRIVSPVIKLPRSIGSPTSLRKTAMRKASAGKRRVLSYESNIENSTIIKSWVSQTLKALRDGDFTTHHLHDAVMKFRLGQDLSSDRPLASPSRDGDDAKQQPQTTVFPELTQRRSTGRRVR